MFINQFAHYNLYMTDMCRSGQFPSSGGVAYAFCNACV